jgi:protein phosphatase PTC7
MSKGKAMADMGRSPTFVVGSDRQRGTLDALVRRDQHFAEQFQKNKPLCFNAKSFQKTHPTKAMKGQKDADATLCSPMILAVADGVSQIEEFGIDASELPNELLNAAEELAVSQLLPGQETEEYCGPINMMKDAYESTEAHGSTTVLTAIMDNSTKIHGKLHPMIAVCSIGDCEILILRRNEEGRLHSAFHTEMQRIDGNAQSPLQLARVDDSVDPDFDPSIAVEVIERGSAVHCVSAFEGDIVVIGSDGVFDNLFIEEILRIVEQMMPMRPAGKTFRGADRQLLEQIAQRIVMESHAKTRPAGPDGWLPTPIGQGGKIDDTSCVVAQVVEWTETHEEAWAKVRSQRMWGDLFSCGGRVPQNCRLHDGDCDVENADGSRQKIHPKYNRKYPSRPNANSFSTYWGGSFSEYSSGTPSTVRPLNARSDPRDEPSDEGCSLM